MKKEKIVMAITIGIACLVLMLVMFIQFKVVKQTDITAIENMRESELRAELASWREKYNELNERYEEVNSKISEYQNEKESDEKTAQLLQQELQQLNEALGKTDLEGEGIVLVLTDNSGKQLSNDEIVKPIGVEDILLIINDLFEAGAEAISINDKRIVISSDVAEVDSFLKINGERIISPYVIKAIGNQSYLESAIIGKGGQVNRLEEAGHTKTLEKSKKIKINKYDGTISSKYID